MIEEAIQVKIPLSLRVLETIPEDPNEEYDSVENGSSLIKIFQRNTHLHQFETEASKINFMPIKCSENFAENYESYLSQTLNHLSKLHSLNFNYALENPLLSENYPQEILERVTKSGKKILLLDLDETLIHAEFLDDYEENDETLYSKYDKVLSFTDKKKPNSEDSEQNPSLNPNSQENSDDEETFYIGIYVRNGAKEFLSAVSKCFEVGIFTASIPEYADAIINHLDPDGSLIKFRLYRDNCINVNDLFNVKDLRIIKGVDLKNIVLVDNNIYSFAAQINNGILINSFYDNKNEYALYDAYSYLVNDILPSKDVRETNKQTFGFKNIIDQYAMQ